MLDCFKYPFDSKLIQRKKKFLRKILLDQQGLIEKRIVVLGGSTTAEVVNMLELFLLDRGVKPIFYESEYGKYYESVFFNNEEIYKFKPDIIYVHTSNVNITVFPKLSDDQDQVNKKLDDEFYRFRSLWEKVLVEHECVVIQNNFELLPYRELGNLDSEVIQGKNNFLLKLNSLMANYACSSKNFYINDINYLSASIGLEKWHDRCLWYTSKYAMSFEAITQNAHNLSAIICAIWGKTSKCLVLDLDNTLWGGEIGDDGVEGILIGNDNPQGEAYCDFQKYIKKLHDRGIILSVCSKNNFDRAQLGFAHKDSVLKLDDFSSFVANWQPKSDNIDTITRELNIGLDSIVFIDDNPAERNLVESQLSSVRVPNLGRSIVDYILHIDRNNFFEPISISSDDLQRNLYYKSNKVREVEVGKFKSFEDYLLSLRMQAEVSSFSRPYLERITQLINKTNQYNLTTKRMTYGEIERLMYEKSSIAFYGRLKDKFGDNGLVSAIIGSVMEDSVNIDLWIMSCRVFKRTMEYVMFDELVRRCRAQNIKKIIGHYIPSPKNNLVCDHYHTIGFSLIYRDTNSVSSWEYNIPEYPCETNKFIEIVRGEDD